MEALGFVISGIGSLLAGLLVVLVTAYVSFFVILAVFARGAALADLLHIQRPYVALSNRWLFITTALFIVVLFVSYAKGARAYYSRIPRVTPLTNPFDPTLFSAAAKLISDMLLSGPSLLHGSLRCFAKAFRLARMDCELCAKILYVLAGRDSRTSFRELCDSIPGINPATLFPQFLDVEGVVFLAKDPSGLSLTGDLRSELRRVIGFVVEAAQPTATLEEEPAEPEEWCFAVLGISGEATAEEAKAAYRKLMKKCHPDLVSDLGEELRELALEKSKEINRSYEEVCARIQERVEQERVA